MDGTSINERRESAGNWQYIALIEEDLYSGALGLEILYDNKRLGQVFKSYDKQKKANGKALAAYLKTQKVPKEKAKQFALSDEIPSGPGKAGELCGEAEQPLRRHFKERTG